MPLTGERPYPFAALIDAAGYPLQFLAAHLRCSWARLQEYEAAGLTADEADEFALRLGRHPAEVWTNWR